MKKYLILICALFALNANAGFLVEPYLGYKFASGDASSTPSGDYSYSGGTIGGRLGYQFLGLMGGFDMSWGTGAYKLEIESAGTKTKNDYTQSTYGLFVGYELPILLRAWASYYFSNELTGDSTSVDGDRYSGGGYGLGVGFTGLPFVSLNLEYRSMSYDEFHDKSAGSKVDPKLDMSEILFSVSLPLDL